MKTVLSVRDFAILYNLACNHIERMERNIRYPLTIAVDAKKRKKEEKEAREELRASPFYQDMLRIREKLGDLQIEVETPSVEVSEKTPCKNALKDELGDLYCGNDKSENLGDFCAVCGEYVPEGRQVCPKCEKVEG